jgi:hypothetical protein
MILPLPSIPFLKWLQQVSVFHIHTYVENTSTIFTFFDPLHLPFLFPVLHYLSICSLFCGVLPLYFTCNILYYNQSNPLYYSSLSCSPCAALFSSFQCYIHSWYQRCLTKNAEK